NFTMQGDCKNGNITAGTLELKGDFVQKGTDDSTGITGNSKYNFPATGTHKVVLSGTSEQNVSFKSSSSYFNILVNKNSNAIFKPTDYKYLFTEIPYIVKLNTGTSDGTITKFLDSTLENSIATQINDLCNLAKDGYNFKGWYLDDKYTVPLTDENDIITSNITLYAKWEDVVIETSKETITSLADGSAEVSVLINEITAEIDMLLEDGVVSEEEKTQIEKLVKDGKKRGGMLNIRFQITSGTTSSSETSDIRFISTVDSLDYLETGFYITIGGVKKRIATKHVYTDLVSKGGGSITSYTPDNIFNESKYFTTYSVWNIPNSAFGTSITVQAFVVTKDGTEILGVEKTRTVNNFIR
ncbi:MAG: hypothetical protein E7473_09235, partial [Ruminococcaceae bacterium]|nr:hypothetical protein [Oscillospiraceae bacterium]